MYPYSPSKLWPLHARNPYVILQAMATFKYPLSDISDPQITTVW